MIAERIKRDVIPASSLAALELTLSFVHEVVVQAGPGIPGQLAAIRVVDGLGHELARDQRAARYAGYRLDSSMHLRHQLGVGKFCSQLFSDDIEISVDGGRGRRRGNLERHVASNANVVPNPDRRHPVQL
ncbi:MAG: hypothetical protein ACREBE_07545, partial [bacterium]